MKTIIRTFTAICILVASVSSCAKDDPADAFGTEISTASPLVGYMNNFAEEIVSESLKILESALRTSSDGGIKMLFYETNNLALTVDGSVWKVKREGDLKGLTISKVAGENAWTLTYSGGVEFTGGTYPTDFTVKAIQKDPAAEGHQNWDILIDGTRTEENGYSCEFTSMNYLIECKALTQDNLWNAFGYIVMTVYKDGNQIDQIVMELAGGRSDSSVVRI
ncbi:MAG: hypothetical protein J5748_06315 [Bacteroidales bacterium]|nr:hypothetical protein [Bacteroidales bacterium]